MNTPNLDRAIQCLHMADMDPEVIAEIVDGAKEELQHLEEVVDSIDRLGEYLSRNLHPEEAGRNIADNAIARLERIEYLRNKIENSPPSWWQVSGRTTLDILDGKQD